MLSSMELACGRNCVRGGALSSMVPPATAASRRPRRAALKCRATAEDVGTKEEKKEAAGPGPSPPAKKKWTGYVEKDTAGQTNIYAVEPTVYVSESVFSSGKAGESAEGVSNNVVLALGLSSVALAGAAAILLTVGNSAPVTPSDAVGYSGPPLSYYIEKFSASAPSSVAPDLAMAPSES